MNIDISSENVNQEITNRVKKLISQIGELITHKNLQPGDKLPSERILADKFGVSRRSIRVAILKLESYGLLKSMPQSGTFVANIGSIAMTGIIDDIVCLPLPNFKSLVEIRILLELKAARLAALRRTSLELKNIKDALDAYETKMLLGDEGLQEDLLFHLAIAKASGNVSIYQIMIIIIPQIIIDNKNYQTDYSDKAEERIKEHTEIYEAIKDQNEQLAKSKMKNHFKLLYKYCDNIK